MRIKRAVPRACIIDSLEAAIKEDVQKKEGSTSKVAAFADAVRRGRCRWRLPLGSPPVTIVSYRESALATLSIAEAIVFD